MVASLVSKTGANVELGLTAYGHRRKSDCKDIEVLVPVGGATSAEIVKTIKGVNPKGKTPLTAAVQQVAEAMDYQQRRTAVVLISDGVETCNADPCAVGAELAMKGTDFTTHVIGFDVKEEDQKGLRCLAKNTGGLFLPAGNTQSLQAALNKTVTEAKQAPEPIVEDPGTASLQAVDEVQAGSAFEVQWQGPDSRSDYVTVVKADARAGAYMSYAYTKEGSPLTITAPDKEGVYQLRYMHSHSNKILATRSIKVKPAAAVLNFPQTIAAGSELLVEWSGPSNATDYITVVAKGADNTAYMSYAYTRSGSPAKLVAPDQPGEYEVRYIMGQTKHVLNQSPITVSQVSATIKAPARVGIGADFSVEWTGPANSTDYLTIVPADAADSAYLSYAYTRNGSPAKLSAPGKPGSYQVRYIQGQSKAALSREPIVVEAVSATLDTPKSVTAGQKFQVKWQGPGNKTDYVTVTVKGAPDSAYLSYAYTRQGSPANLMAPNEPGDYEVRYVLGSPKVVIGREVIRVE